MLKVFGILNIWAKYDDIKNTILTPYKELNMLIYRMPFCFIICVTYELLKWSSLAQPIYSCLHICLTLCFLSLVVRSVIIDVLS